MTRQQTLREYRTYLEDRIDFYSKMIFYGGPAAVKRAERELRHYQKLHAATVGELLKLSSST